VQAEFVIVGGGIYGAATAWSLARRGADVLLLETTAMAAGASGGLGKRGVRANSTIRPWPARRPLRKTRMSGSLRRIHPSRPGY
jgi:sarcosine oxidase, subunit beta